VKRATTGAQGAEGWPSARCWTLGAVAVLILSVGACDRTPVDRAGAEVQTAAPGVPPRPADEAPRTLWLTAAEGAPDGQVAAVLHYARREGQVAPRMMEVRVAYGVGLRFLAAEPLAGLTDAGKRLVAQDAPAAAYPEDGAAGGGEVRLVAFASSNLAALEPGALVRLTFQQVGVGGTLADRTVRVRARMPIFAPQGANEGVLLGEGLALASAVEQGGTP